MQRGVRICSVLAASWLLTGGVRAQERPASWTTNDDFLVFFDAVRKVVDHGLGPVDTRALIERSLTAVLDGLDPYSEYLPPEAFAAYRASLRSDYAGVGMEIAREGDDEVACFPYPGGPAAFAGVRDADRLVAVDGVPTRGRPLHSVGAGIRGLPDASVELTVQRGGDPEQTLTVKRAPVRARSVVTTRRCGVPVMRIHSFTTGTADEVEQVMRALDGATPLVIDARSNPGGDLFAAMDVARRFLPRGSTLGTLRARDGDTPYTVNEAPTWPERRLYIMQDRRTASAAEFFVAALTGNGRARSLGERTFGKGTTQKVIELVDGSGLVITDAVMRTPRGETFHGAGLAPDIYIDMAAMDEEDVFRRVADELRADTPAAE